jgi:hypothetical protein
MCCCKDQILIFLSDIPLSTLRKWNAGHFVNGPESLPWDPKEEIQAAAPLYMPFLVWNIRRHYKLYQICDALNTHTLDEYERERFEEAYEHGDLQPRLLNTLSDRRTPRIAATHQRPTEGAPPTNSPSSTAMIPFTSSNVQTSPSLSKVGPLDVLSGTPIAPSTDGHDQDDNDWGRFLDFDVYSAAINVSISGYKTFDLPEELQQKALRAGETQSGSNWIERRGSRLRQYDFEAPHALVAEQVADELVGDLYRLERLKLTALGSIGCPRSSTNELERSVFPAKYRPV